MNSFAVSAPQRARSASERAAESQQCWLPAGQPVTIGSYMIASGLLYVGTALSRSDGLGIENCLINPSLAISADSRDDHGDRMSYYPSYAFIEPACRASYLNWLAGGKADPGICIGYVFLYFYGLERRLFLDDASDEASAIVAEVRRLRTIYGNNHSFDRYSSALLDAAAIKGGTFESSNASDLRKSGWEIPLGLRAEIGRSIANGDNLTAQQMLAWYCSHPDRRLSPSILSRCPDEFRQLFASRFAEKFSQGLKVPTPARKLSAVYKAASDSFSVQITGAYQQWPDIISLTAPLNAIQPVIDGCVEELQPYARRLGQKSDKRGALETALALPQGLNNPVVTAPIQALKQFCETALTGAVSVVSPAELLRAAGVIEKTGDKFGKAEMGMLSQALAHCGFGMEPDTRSNYTKVDDDDVIALFRLTAGRGGGALSPGYAAAAVLVDLGAAIATADGVFAIVELEAIQKSIAANASLSAEERHRLMARTAFRARKPALLRDFKRFAAESPDQRTQLARFAVSIAAADSRLAVEEVRMLEKLYRTLNLTEAQLYSDLQSMGANAAEVSATIAPGGPPSPSQPAASDGTDRGIALDPHRLARTREETARVSALLEQVFADEATPLVKSQPAVPANAVPTDGLDARYRDLVQMLCQHDTLSRAEFDDLAHDKGVLPDGAIEAINDWAYSKFDQPFLEEGEPVTIDRALLQRKKEDA